MTILILAAAVLVGMALLSAGLLLRARRRDRDLAQILELPYGEQDVPVEAITEGRNAIARSAVNFTGKMVDKYDARGSLGTLLERARIPMRPAEYIVVTLCGAVAAGALVGIMTSQWIIGAAAALATPMVSMQIPKVRIARRKKAFEAQLPDALSLIASSLSAGHTFLRAIQMMCEESEPPMSEEFARVVYETRLGDPVVDALDRMAVRLEISDLRWVVQAIRIQQQVGGKLADLLHTLADFIRAREEVRREINVLTAEGRISAWVLGGMPVALLFAIQVMNPGYAAPLFRGFGYVVLALTGGSVLLGVTIIRRMVRIEV